MRILIIFQLNSYLLRQWQIREKKVLIRQTNKQIKRRPNLKNLSGGLNLSRGLNMVGSTWNCIKCFKIYNLALNLNRFLADLNRGSNSLNSISGCVAFWFHLSKNKTVNSYLKKILTIFLCLFLYHDWCSYFSWDLMVNCILCDN